MQIRAYDEGDWPQVWPIIEAIVRKADTFCYDPLLNEAQAHAMWVVPPPGHVVVAVNDGRILGTSNMYANRPGPGSHIASGNLMVAPDERGRGVGQALGGYLLAWARESGYAGVQFNAVAASNAPALKLYERLGFTVVGTVPGAFRHPDQGFVGLHVMYHDLHS
ncbi:Acetyltransferase (GNAT) family protein [Actinopolymorpha cephalotaxi]|uniref:Acetyltransferase (GNAT) family protein n=1 Tax=Actinopolymorpha cephalotaxi TaxID=504797 RepID=A0A1I2ZUT7_9ACTN|nr:GNAT family N-acetyltransferase [Actinopolymorpha cephalotaxi]NYH84175.1 GNAT superfamily N-acetyltransferase [Actinopolymorpha cephalotaxi]SFH41440.1 Acetyltransferase (GNAT) family protein [Actinopolymorpha cephalotaxi]